MQLKQIGPPNLVDILNEHKREINSEMNCVQIGIIQSFDPADQTATVKIALKKVAAVDAMGVRTIQEHPLLLKCPVFVLYGGNGYLTMPIAEGDDCILLFNDREIDNWFVNGGEQTPDSYRVHDYSDGLAIVGLRNLQTALQNYIIDGVKLGYGASSLTIKDAAATLLTTLFTINADVQVNGDVEVNGNITVTGEVSSLGNFDIVGSLSATDVHAGNGATGSFTIVTVVDGIVTGGS